MSNALSFEPKVKRLVNWLKEVENGELKTPQFQRDFVWGRSDIKQLFDSIKNGYPIGSILLWKPTGDSFESTDLIGPFSIKKDKDQFWYILDGFQRISTLFGCLTNPHRSELKCDETLRNKMYNLHYDLEVEDFFYPRSSNSVEPFQVPIYEIIDTKASFKFQSYLYEQNISSDKVELYMERYADLGTTFIDYELPSIGILGGNIQEAVEIFSRVNSKGATISPDWMISALTYNKDKNFRLGSLIDEVLVDLKRYNFSEIANGRELVLKCITSSFGNFYIDQSTKIEQLAKREDFIHITNLTIVSIKKAVKFLFESLSVVDSKLLPYSAQLIFISDFFFKLKKPNSQQLTDLKRWFWVTTYSNYFTIHSINILRKAYDQFHKYLRCESSEIIYNEKPNLRFKTADFPKKINHRSVRFNALCLFLLNYTNDFKKIDSNMIEGVSISNLFDEYKDENGSYFPESIIVEFKLGGGIKKNKDMSHLIINFKSEFEKYILTKDLQQLIKSKNYTEIISQRKNLITKYEKAFVIDLGLEYSE